MSKPAHLPFLHPTHKYECGYAPHPLQRGHVIVCDCGAAYLMRIVFTFPIWRCYDCNRKWLLARPAPGDGERP